MKIDRLIIQAEELLRVEDALKKRAALAQNRLEELHAKVEAMIAEGALKDPEKCEELAKYEAQLTMIPRGLAEIEGRIAAVYAQMPHVYEDLRAAIYDIWQAVGAAAQAAAEEQLRAVCDLDALPQEVRRAAVRVTPAFQKDGVGFEFLNYAYPDFEKNPAGKLRQLIEAVQTIRKKARRLCPETPLAAAATAKNK